MKTYKAGEFPNTGMAYIIKIQKDGTPDITPVSDKDGAVDKYAKSGEIIVLAHASVPVFFRIKE